MAKKKRLALEDCKKLADLDYEHLIEHAGNTSIEAVDYLESLLETVDYTEEELKEKRHTLETAFKFEYVKDENGQDKLDDKGRKIIAKDPNGVELGKPSYTRKKIEQLMKEAAEAGKPKYKPAEVKKLYCAKYWEDMLGEQKSSQKQKIEDRKKLLAEARKRAAKKK